MFLGVTVTRGKNQPQECSAGAELQYFGKSVHSLLGLGARSLDLHIQAIGYIVHKTDIPIFRNNNKQRYPPWIVDLKTRYTKSLKSSLYEFMRKSSWVISI